MSKRDLKKYLSGLDKEQVEDQLLELYDKFKEVKVYYDFVFSPREEKLVQEAKSRIVNEYFPIKSKRAKLRRSVAQKYIKHFIVLGVDPPAVADVMLFAIETAMRYSARREMKYNSFYKSILTAFDQALNFSISNGIYREFDSRLEEIAAEAKKQRWENTYQFELLLENVKV
ncbi:MAG TPA: DUF6155 family protein [Flavobacterium sp.]|jgi:hypothetical protein